MWKEILVDDIEGLEKYVAHYNTMFCNIEKNSTISTELIKKILNLKKDCHCYYYSDIERDIIVLYKYDDVYDIIVIFQHFDNTPSSDMLRFANEAWDIYRGFIKTIAEKHNKIIRWSKYPKAVQNSPEWKKTMGKTSKEQSELRISKYAEYGLKAIEFEMYWEYELI